MPPSPVLLSSLPPGSRCTVVCVETNGETSPIDRRLLDLGFVPGTAVRVIRRAPMGDPTAFALRGFEVCLRQSESSRISVQVEDS